MYKSLWGQCLSVEISCQDLFLSFGVIMVSPFKGMELAGILSLILVCQPILCGYIHVAAAAITESPGHPSQSSVLVNITTASSSAPPTSPTPSISVVPPGELPNSFPENFMVTSGVNFDTSWQQCEVSQFTHETISDSRSLLPQSIS